MELQTRIYEEVRTWMCENRFTPVPLYGNNEALCIKFDDLIHWMGHSPNVKNALKAKLKDCPTFGSAEAGLILVKYLPRFIASYTPQTDVALRERIDTLLERFGLMTPQRPIGKVYFFEFRVGVEFRSASGGLAYCKIGSTKNLIETRFNAFRSYVPAVTDAEETQQCDILGYIESEDASTLEKQIQEDFRSYHTDIFRKTKIVGYGECYELPPNLRDFILTIVADGVYELPESVADNESFREFIETRAYKMNVGVHNT